MKNKIERKHSIGRTKPFAPPLAAFTAVLFLGAAPYSAATDSPKALDLQKHVADLAALGIQVSVPVETLEEWVLQGQITREDADALLTLPQPKAAIDACGGLPEAGETLDPQQDAAECLAEAEAVVLLEPGTVPPIFLITNTVTVELGTRTSQDNIDGCCSKNLDSKINIDSWLDYSGLCQIDDAQTANCGTTIQVSHAGWMEIELWDRDPGPDDLLDVHNGGGLEAFISIDQNAGTWRETGNQCNAVAFGTFCTVDGGADTNPLFGDGDDGGIAIKIT